MILNDDMLLYLLSNKKVFLLKNKNYLGNQKQTYCWKTIWETKIIFVEKQKLFYLKKYVWKTESFLKIQKLYKNKNKNELKTDYEKFNLVVGSRPVSTF